jgi:hypothetical protein
MKTDTYTKAVLTVIAACLIWMCVTRQMPAVQAQAQPQAQPQPPAAQQPAPPVRVILVDQFNRPLYGAQGLLVNFGAGPPAVHDTNPSVGVTVNAIQRTAAWDPVEVKVLRDAPTLMPVP